MQTMHDQQGIEILAEIIATRVVEQMKMEIKLAEFNDLEELLKLQHYIFEIEARQLGNFGLPALTQEMDGMIEEFANGVVFKAVKNGKIIGSVRGMAKDGTLYIAKLMVHPDHRKNGIASKLMTALEEYSSQSRFELFTPDISQHNIRLYEKLGYRIFDKMSHHSGVTFVLMEKLKSNE